MTAGVFGEIAADGKRIVIVVSGDDHELKQAAVAMKKMTMLFEPSKPPGALAGPLSWATVTQLAHTFSGGYLGQWIPGPRLREWTLAEFLRRTGHAAEPHETAMVEQPAAATAPARGNERTAGDTGTARRTQPAASPGRAAITTELAARPVQSAEEILAPRPYQAEGAAMIGTGGKFLLFDDPGCGKTVTTILGLLERQRRGHAIFPMVIVVPSWDVGDVWARHVRDWAPEWPVPVMHAGKDRSLNHAASRESGVLVTTYATARLDAPDAQGPLARLRARAVVADEVHLAKNEGSQQSQALRRIARHAETFVGLSGTPVTRDTGDVYPVLAAMDPLDWPSRERMVKRYCMTTDGEYEDKIEGLAPLAEPEFRAVLLGQYRRVAKADVLAQLPPKVYSVRRVELPAQWRRAYDGLAADMLAELPDGSELEVMSVLAQLTRLSQLASSAADVEVTVEHDEVTGEQKKRYDVTLRAPSWKAGALLEVLAERKGRQAVVFTVSRQLADITRVACEQAGYRCGAITGSQGKRARKADIDAFQAGQLDVMIATAGAGSLGITLTAAGTAVFLQRSWQLDQAIQAEDRLHRIGQEHDSVEVIDIIAKDTVDDRVRQLLREKSGQLGQLVRDPRIARELLGGLH